MQKEDWSYSFIGSITVCDPEGIILEMNEQAAKVFERFGGMKLIGSNMLECFPEEARGRVEKMLSSKTKNVYTLKQNGSKQLVYQTPWYQDGEYAGFVELILPIPMNIPNISRSKNESASI